MTTLELDSLVESRPARVPAKRARVTYNAAMKLLRRVHLYSGLFMTPWVFLYGATALLFNHPDLFSGRQVIDVGPAELAGTPLAQVPRPDDLAARVIDRLNAADPVAGYRRTSGDAARYAQPLTAGFNRDGKPYNLRLDLATLDGAVREGALRQARGGPAPERPPGEAPAAGDRQAGERKAGERQPGGRGGPGPDAGGSEPSRGDGGTAGAGERGPRGRDGERTGERTERTGERRGRPGGPTTRDAAAAGAASRPAAVPTTAPAAGPAAGPRLTATLDLPAFAGAADAVPAVLGKLGVTATDVAVRPIPELTFSMDDARGKTWRARFDPATGNVAATPAGPGTDREPPGTRQFLLNLHKAHGYPAAFGPRWAWAVAVDAMFLSMCGWGLTGLLMWWQMKNLRLVGSVILVVSAATATVMIVAMHGAMVG